MTMDGSISSEPLHPKISIRGSQVSYRLDSFDDPDIGMVLRWHISICPVCKESVNRRPAGFGIPSTRFCDEYWEIIKEYSDYEQLYAQVGNP